MQRVRNQNFRKQPCGKPESSQNSRRTASLSSPLWYPHGYPNPTTVRLASSILVPCPELHPRNSNGPRASASHRPIGVKNEFPQRQYTPPRPAKKRRKCSRWRAMWLRTTQSIDPAGSMLIGSDLTPPIMPLWKRAGSTGHWPPVPASAGSDSLDRRRGRRPQGRQLLRHPYPLFPPRVRPSSRVSFAPRPPGSRIRLRRQSQGKAEVPQPAGSLQHVVSSARSRANRSCATRRYRL